MPPPRGVGSTNEYARSSGTPSSASASARMAANGTGGTSSCSPSSSFVISGGSTSRRDDMNCPTLIMRPPRSTASTWKRCAKRCRRAAAAARGEPAEADARQEQLEPPRLHEVAARRTAGSGGSGRACCRRRSSNLLDADVRRATRSVLSEDRVELTARLVEDGDRLLHLLGRAGAADLRGGLGELDARLRQRARATAVARARAPPTGRTVSAAASATSRPSSVSE